MIFNKKPSPPRWAERLISWYCRQDLLEDLQGDLNEYFERNVKSKGVRRAKFIYILDAFKFLRLYTVRKPEFLNLLINWIMLGSYIKTSSRSMVRNKLFSAINIIGLAISMSVGLLLIALLVDMAGYDRFHENYDRTYRVISHYQYLDRADRNAYASTSLHAGKSIQESIPGIEKLTIARGGFAGDVAYGEKKVPLEGLYADESFLTVFTFPMLQGDPSTALKNPFSIVLTESAAKKLFGETDAIGKVIIPFDTMAYTVTGVIKDVPRFSHIRFDMLASLSTLEITDRENKRVFSWDNIWNFYVYVVLPSDTNLSTLQSNLDALCAREDKTVKNTKIRLGLQRLGDIALGPDLNNSIGPVMGSGDVWMIGVLSFVVILSACFNYTNLSVARSLRRSREVGIRKVIGALKGHVLGQFITEAVIISLVALVFSFGLFILSRPYFLDISPKLQEMLTLDLSARVIGYFILLAVVIGIGAGLFPALFFARMNAVQVLKDVSAVRLFRNLNMRKALIVLQYTLSIMFIGATVIGFKQYKYLLSFDLGYTTENIFNIRLQGNNAELLEKEFRQLPEVTGLSKSVIITSIGNYWGTKMKYNNPQDSTYVYYNSIDENYIPLHNHTLLAGRNFNAHPEGTQESEVIVNEQTLKRFEIGGRDPQKALDEIVTIDGKKMKIIGVMKDYQYGKADNQTKEVIFLCGNRKPQYINLKLATTDWPSTLLKIDNIWRTFDNVHPMEGRFYSEQIERSYGEIAAMLKILGYLAFFAICISSMGMLGMVVFTTETRLKEISIRKVMGATEFKLILLLSRGFLLLLAIAAAIALPATYFFFDKVVLREMANHAPIQLFELMLGVAVVMMIALLMIGSQTLKVARANPAEVLKNE